MFFFPFFRFWTFREKRRKKQKINKNGNFFSQLLFLHFHYGKKTWLLSGKFIEIDMLCGFCQITKNNQEKLFIDDGWFFWVKYLQHLHSIRIIRMLSNTFHFGECCVSTDTWLSHSKTTKWLNAHLILCNLQELKRSWHTLKNLFYFNVFQVFKSPHLSLSKQV